MPCAVQPPAPPGSARGANAAGRLLTRPGFYGRGAPQDAPAGAAAPHDKPDGTGRTRPPDPVLLLEDEAGALLATDAAALLVSLRPVLSRLLFLSSCRSAAAPGHGPEQGIGLPPAPSSKRSGGDPDPAAAQAPAFSLTSALIQAGLPAGHTPLTFLSKEIPVAPTPCSWADAGSFGTPCASWTKLNTPASSSPAWGGWVKSSLAVRIANRHRDRWALAVLHGRFGR